MDGKVNQRVGSLRACSVVQRVAESLNQFCQPCRYRRTFHAPCLQAGDAPFDPPRGLLYDARDKREAVEAKGNIVRHIQERVSLVVYQVSCSAERHNGGWDVNQEVEKSKRL